MSKHKIVLDLETKNSFQDAGTRDAALLDVSVVGVYDYTDDAYRIYDENELAELGSLLEEASLIIGFNLRRFDLPVLDKYYSFPTQDLPILDIMEEMQKVIGHRVSLNSVAGATLGLAKSGDGLDAIKYYREGRLDELKKYCLDDVRITKEVYEYGCAHGKLLYTLRNSSEVRSVGLRWVDHNERTERIKTVIREAFLKKVPLEIDYLSEESTPHNEFFLTDTIDMYTVAEEEIEVYSHRKKAIHRYHIDRILAARLIWGSYSIPSHYMPTLHSIFHAQ